ncbi:MAG TPA: hypothetical protein VEW67_01920 [Thermoleophilaceae bacterium]|nr:hypothetical protein [Thermoleophilaceae bacterium]
MRRKVSTSSAIADATSSSAVPSSVPSLLAQERRANSRQSTPAANWSLR